MIREDAMGNPLAVREYNGETRNFEYDTAYRLTRELRKDAGGGTIYDESFVYDPVGNRTRRIKDGVETRYFHNANNQVVEEETTGTTTRYFYDRNGNQIRKAAPGHVEHFDFDELNRMTGYRKTGGGPPETTTYTHRGGGHIRASKTTGGVTTRYLLDGYREIAEYENGTQTKYFTHGTYIDEVLMMNVAQGDNAGNYYYHADSLYSVAALTDANGAAVERMKYDAYGTATILAPDGVTVRSQSQYGNPWTFTGRRLDQETGLHDFRNRTWDSRLGRFLNRDPLGYVDGMGLYNGYFVPNGVDPLGLYELVFTGYAAGSPFLQDMVKRSFERVRNKLSNVLKQIDVAIAELDKCPECYGDLLKKLRALRDRMQKVKDNMYSDQTLYVSVDDIGTGKSARASPTPDAVLFGYVNPMLEYNDNPGNDWTSTSPSNKDQKTFHELLHFEGTDDGESKDPFNDSHRLEPLLEVPLDKWGPYANERAAADEKAKKGECCCPSKK